MSKDIRQILIAAQLSWFRLKSQSCGSLELAEAQDAPASGVMALEELQWKAQWSCYSFSLPLSFNMLVILNFVRIVAFNLFGHLSTLSLL